MSIENSECDSPYECRECLRKEIISSRQTLDIWNTPDKIPKLYTKERIVGIVCERYHTEYSKDGRTKKVIHKKFPFMIILEATEDGWRCDDDVFDGYSSQDCTLWAYERDFAKIVDSVIPNFDWS